MLRDHDAPDSKTRGPDQVIHPVAIPSQEAFGTPTLWLTASFAQLWFKDALLEASREQDSHARRREILFAVATAESYLLEWVRDDVLQRDFTALNRVFPVGERRPILEKWKEIPKQLLASGLITAVPNLGSGATWREFQLLVEFRNGLLHARSSRPETAGLPEANLPVPSLGQLQTLDPGWPSQVVRRLILELCAATGTTAPYWLATNERDIAI